MDYELLTPQTLFYASIALALVGGGWATYLLLEQGKELREFPRKIEKLETVLNEKGFSPEERDFGLIEATTKYSFKNPYELRVKIKDGEDISEDRKREIIKYVFNIWEDKNSPVNSI